MSNRRRILMGQSKGGPRLPKEYQEVEYLESTGTQYIDTGVLPTTYTQIEITYSNFSSANSKLFGRRRAENVYNFFVYSTSNGKYGVAYGSQYSETSVSVDSNKHTLRYNVIENSLSCFYLDNILLKQYAVETIGGGLYPIVFFAFNRNGTIDYSNYKAYSFKITESGVDIHNYVPCYRKSDNEPGMYDLVSGQFFTNQGSGEFIVGPEIYELNQVQFVEYLYSDNATIDNIYTGTLGLHYEAKVDIKQIYSWQSVGGLNVGSGSSAFGFQRNSTSNTIYFNNNIRNAQINIPSGTGKYLFVVDNATDASIKNWDGVVIGSGSAGWGMSKTISVQLRGIELYTMTIGNNIYLPCIIGTKIGLYNKTNKTFFPCTSGTITPGQNK